MRGIHAATLNFDSVRAEFELPEAFGDDVEREAADAVDRFADRRRDARDVPFVTIDPPGTRDLDQAVHVVPTASGFRLHYAIADVGAFVTPGTALHDEAMRRGQTVYLPDGNVPLHPRALSEDRASLLPGVDRPCVLWSIDVDARGETTAFTVERAIVRSRAQLDYASVQADVDAGRPLPEALSGLRGFGEARQARALRRGAIELRLPAQDLERAPDGSWTLRLEPRTTVDAWNAECSLATGQCAAALMVRGRTGLLRTLPAPSRDTLRDFRAAAAALGLDWPEGLAAGAFLASLPPGDVRTLALMSAATKLLRGSGYLAFTPADPAPTREQLWHAGVADDYAHATAPLRRLADRFASEICLALAAGDPVPSDLLEALPDVPGRMSATSRVANAVSNACLNQAEAVALDGRVGEVFEAAVLRGGTDSRDAEIFVADPPVIADCAGAPPLGVPIRVRLQTADPDARDVRFGYPADDGAVPDASGGAVASGAAGAPGATGAPGAAGASVAEGVSGSSTG